MTEYYKYPRLYLKSPFNKNEKLQLEKQQAHYLINVLRKNHGDAVRVFNGTDGEWLTHMEVMSKKSVQLRLEKQLRAQDSEERRSHLYFTPMQKNRMDFLIEKSVELGVTELFPIITSRTEHRKINVERLEAQIAEACEQCERLDVPVLHNIQKLTDIKPEVPLYACLEREKDLPNISLINFGASAGFLIGPPGGFDDDEIRMIKVHKNIEKISLGDNILRAETAALICLSYTLNTS
ncbi:MAG: RsmE family RNA methyltransferase [Alphaproteobacteria bacterium]|nr:RsmE family RNA methyltransferase [Alphaproteobacteria bacterium]